MVRRCVPSFIVHICSTAQILDPQLFSFSWANNQVPIPPLLYSPHLICPIQDHDLLCAPLPLLVIIFSLLLGLQCQIKALLYLQTLCRNIATLIILHTVSDWFHTTSETARSSKHKVSTFAFYRRCFLNVTLGHSQHQTCLEFPQITKALDFISALSAITVAYSFPFSMCMSSYM